MRGFPKHCNTKADFLYVKEHFDKEKWLPLFQGLLDTQYNWTNTGEVEEAAGITDDTHKVVIDEIPQEDGTTVKKFYQFVWEIQPKCKLLRLGFTADEVKAIIEAAK